MLQKNILQHIGGSVGTGWNAEFQGGYGVGGAYGYNFDSKTTFFQTGPSTPSVGGYFYYVW